MVAADTTTNRFTRWRQSRPFVAGLLIMLSGVVIITPAYLTLRVADILIQISSLSGVSTLLIGILLITAGLMTWFKADVRIFTGVMAIVLGIIALPASNIGGFVLGTLLAIIGGAWALSWSEKSKAEHAEAKATQATDNADSADNARGNGVTDTADSGVVTEVPDYTTSTSTATDDELKAGISPHPDTIELPSTDPVQPPSSRVSKRTAVNSVVIAVVSGLVLLNATIGSSDAQAQINFPPPPAWAPSPPPPPLTLPPAPGSDGAAPLPPLQLPDIPEGILPPGVVPPGGILGPGKTDSEGREHKAIFDTSPPVARPGEQPPNEGSYLITTDKTTLVGNVKFSLVDITTQDGVVKRAIRIDSDKAILDNLAVNFPSGDGANPQQMSSGPGRISSLTGNFHIVVAKATMTPVINGVPTIPITLDASWAPEELTRAFDGALAMGMPDSISSKMTIQDCFLDTYIVRADTLRLPYVDIQKPAG